MTAAIGEAGEGTGTGLAKKRANFTSRELIFLPISPAF